MATCGHFYATIATGLLFKELIGGEESARIISDADACMREEGVLKPERFAALLAPGLPARRRTDEAS